MFLCRYLFLQTTSIGVVGSSILIRITQIHTYIMVNIRQATVHDLLHMQTTNLWCLPENYQVRACKERKKETVQSVRNKRERTNERYAELYIAAFLVLRRLLI